MKNSYIRYAVIFASVFFIGALFVVAGDENAPPIWERSIGDYLFHVLGVVLFAMVVFALPILIQAKRVGDKHKKYHEKYSIPYANEKGECYCGQ